MSKQTIQQYMSEPPITIGQSQKLSAAHRVMREHKIRHLPVLEGGELVGILSQRDLYMVETLRDVNPEEAEVADAMTPDPLVVSPEAPLFEVAQAMVAHKYGSAIVKQGRKVVGIFTTTDALRALAGRVREPGASTRR
jgi:acetoin utilization protein AcuB